MTEPIASSTLALLYLAQGHRSRARATLDEVLAVDPTNGHALVLAARMQRRPRAELHARLLAASVAPNSAPSDCAELEFTWSFPRELVPPDHRVHVVFGVATPERESLRYSSIPCLDHQASQRVSVPRGPASAAIVLVASRSGAPLRLLTIADVVRW